MAGTDLLARLIADGMSPLLIAEVADVLARAALAEEALAARRASDRGRQKTRRNVMSRDVTLDNGMSQVDPPDGFPSHTLPFLNPPATDENAHDPEQVISTLTAAAGEALDPTSVNLHVASEILAWIAGGADMRLDIVPTVKRLAAKAKRHAIRDWKYFRKAVIEARDGRLAGLPAYVAVVGTVGGEPVMWITEEHPKWAEYSARYHQEKRVKVYARGSRSENGLGWHFPKHYQDTASVAAA